MIKSTGPRSVGTKLITITEISVSNQVNTNQDQKCRAGYKNGVLLVMA